jgi:hypothetical protein
VQRRRAGRLRAGAGGLAATQRPFTPCEDDYLVYSYNRFQACRFGLDAVYVDPATGTHQPLRDHLLASFDSWRPWPRSARPAARWSCCTQVQANRNHARWLRECQQREDLLAEVIRQASLKFRKHPLSRCAAARFPELIHTLAAPNSGTIAPIMTLRIGISARLLHQPPPAPACRASGCSSSKATWRSGSCRTAWWR